MITKMAFGVQQVRDFLAYNGYVLTVRGYDYKTTSATVPTGNSAMPHPSISTSMKGAAGCGANARLRTVIDKARRIAAAMLDVDAGDISFADGLFVALNSNRRLTLFDVARGIDELASLPDDLREAREDLQAVRAGVGRRLERRAIPGRWRDGRGLLSGLPRSRRRDRGRRRIPKAQGDERQRQNRDAEKL